MGKLGPLRVSLSSCFISESGAPGSRGNSFSFRDVCTLGLSLLGRRFGTLFHNRRIRLPGCSFPSNGDIGDKGGLGLRPGGILIMRKVRTLGPRLATRIPRRRVFHICTSTLAAVLLSGRGCVPAASGHLLHHVVHSCGCENMSTRRAVHH